ncbi:MAG TPA: hypothetical protein PLU53_02790 [Bacteroidia bacterium]|nr:hypothetical protein [Bacteroidia bacterium]
MVTSPAVSCQYEAPRICVFVLKRAIVIAHDERKLTMLTAGHTGVAQLVE